MRRWNGVHKRWVWRKSSTIHLPTKFYIYIAIKEREREDSGKKAETNHG